MAMQPNLTQDRPQKKKIFILGAGISGLSLAYFLSRDSSLQVTILEKERRLGGWLQTDAAGEFFFERGPRTFRLASAELLSLVEDLGLQEEIIYSDKQAQVRYLWKGGRLHTVPKWTFSLLKALSTEWAKSPSSLSDETIWEFACRRFNAEVAYQFFDLLSIGIYGGDMKKLSIRSCFPLFFQWEKEFGSLTKGWWKSRSSKPSGLFSFRKGTESLIQALAGKSTSTICLDEEVKSVRSACEGVYIQTSKGFYLADYVFSALPAPASGALFHPQLKEVVHQGSHVAHVGYKEKIEIPKGFGYIVSSLEKSNILGVVFDSTIFPQQNKRVEETRLTVMFRGGDAQRALREHLQITKEPAYFFQHAVDNAFPQMEVGYAEKIQAIQQDMERDHPRIKLIGNYITGVGVNDCVRSAKSAADTFFKATAS